MMEEYGWKSLLKDATKYVLLRTVLATLVIGVAAFIAVRFLAG